MAEGELPRPKGSGLREKSKIVPITGNGSVSFPDVDRIIDADAEVQDASTSIPTSIATVTSVTNDTVKVVVVTLGSTSNSVSSSSKTVKVTIRGESD